MAFGFFRKRPPEAAAPVVAAHVVSPAAAAGASESDSAREILELPELELGGMIRQFDRAAHSVAGGAEAAPQRPGDVARNTANSRNRRIFNDPAGHNLRSYLTQSYARDMGSGKTVRMREIDVPIRVQGHHWGGFRTACKL